MVLKVRRTFTARVKTMPLFYSAGRPEAVPYICSLGGYVRVGGDAHIAPLYITSTRIATLLPLPAGEVAMPQGIDGHPPACGRA